MTTGNGVHHVPDDGASGNSASGNSASGNGASGNGPSGNGADIRARDGDRDGDRQLRDIEELVAKLQVVTRQLEFPARTVPVRSHPRAELR
jgi:hypothetical protein